MEDVTKCMTPCEICEYRYECEKKYDEEGTSDDE
jgi:hypothetical protein